MGKVEPKETEPPIRFDSGCNWFRFSAIWFSVLSRTSWDRLIWFQSRFQKSIHSGLNNIAGAQILCCPAAAFKETRKQNHENRFMNSFYSIPVIQKCRFRLESDSNTWCSRIWKISENRGKVPLAVGFAVFYMILFATIAQSLVRIGRIKKTQTDKHISIWAELGAPLRSIRMKLADKLSTCAGQIYALQSCFIPKFSLVVCWC